MQLQLKQIAELLEGDIEGDENITITTISSLETAKKGSITFLANPKYQHFMHSTEASAVIVSKTFQPQKRVNAAFIRVDDPYLSFTVLLEEYQRMHSLKKTGIDSSVHLGTDSSYGDRCYIGAFTYIGDQVRIGHNVKIHPQVYIGDHTRIGNNCIIFPGVKIYENTIIGNFCTLQAGAIIGSHGFGFAPQPDGSYRNIPQVGNVILEDHVDVGANTTIDCGTFESTLIKKGAKIDNLVQIAHNVEVGMNTVVASQTGISGSTKIGSQVILGGQVGIAGHIQVADGTKAGGQTGITRTIRENDRVLFGTPAVDKGHFMKSYAIFKKLPEVMKRMEEVEQKLLNLPQPEK